MCILCILIPALTGLIAALLGYFLGRSVEKNSDVYVKLRHDLDACKKEHEKQLSLNTSLKVEVSELNNKYNLLKSGKESNTLRFAEAETPKVVFNAELARSVFGKKIAEDDLKIVEGIGPKIEGLFHEAGIKTWKDLAGTPVEKCQKILDSAGEKYRIHDPGSWPKQSEMAALGKWKELREWQESHKAGKE